MVYLSICVIFDFFPQSLVVFGVQSFALGRFIPKVLYSF